MRLTCVLSVSTLLVLTVEAGTLSRQKRQTNPNSADCGVDTTLVETRLIKTTDHTKCPISTIISRYWDPFLDECEHWMGSRPDHVASSNVHYCVEDTATGGVEIRAKLCCKGNAPANRCLTYSGCSSNDPATCDYQSGAITTCAADEQCETEYTCGTTGVQATLVKRCVKLNSCSSSSSCAAKTYLYQGESCATCCNSVFCNKGGSKLSCFPRDTCSCPNMVAGNFRCQGSTCVCKTGCSGDRCQNCAATCTPNPCNNGGRCKLSATGISCCCAPGFGGTNCDTVLPECAQSTCNNRGKCVNNGGAISCVCNDGYYGNNCESTLTALKCSNPTNVYKIKQAPLASRTCGSVVNVALSKTSELSACSYHMRDSHNSGSLFVDGTNGRVTEVSDVQYSSCNNDACGDALSQAEVCCPSCYSSPCQNGGYCIQTPFKAADAPLRDYVCRCKFGFTGTYCEETVKTCFIYGEPHYNTLDGKPFTFQGVCEYVLVQTEGSASPQFTVLNKNEHRGSDTSVSFPEYLQINIYGYSVRLGRFNVVQVKQGSGQFQTISLNAQYSGFTIKKIGRFVIFSTSFLVAAFDGQNMMYVQVADKYAGDLSGLCNNMDGNPDNDLTGCNGVVQPDTAAGYTALGDSCLSPGQNEAQCETIVPPECDETPYKSNNWCGQIINTAGPFGECAGTEEAQRFYKACLYDVCRNNSNKCSAIQNFVTRCQQPSRDWRSITNCPMTCTANSQYVFEGSACQPTCEDKQASSSCDAPDTEVCVCNAGTILQDEKCVPISRCGCKDSNNVRRMFGEVWDVDPKACKQKKCVQCTQTDCKYPGKVVEETSPSTNGAWGPWSSWSACDVATNTLNRTRSCDNPAPQCGGPTCPGDSVQRKPCPVVTTVAPPTTPPTLPPTTQPPTPICVPDFDFTKACNECEQTENGLMFFADPCSCGKYYQCDPLGGNQFRVHLRKCSYCTCFDPDILTCVADTKKENPEHAKCKNTPPVPQVITSNGGECTNGQLNSQYQPRRFRTVTNDNTKYIDVDAGNVIMPCPSGTVFKVDLCICDHGNNNIQKQQEFLCLDFNDPAAPFRTSTYLWVQPRSGSIYRLVSPGVYSHAMHFSKLTIEVPSFKNKEIRRITISLWYRRDVSAPETTEMALISNDDCRGAANIEILSTSLTGLNAGINTVRTNLRRALTSNVAKSEWVHVALTYSVDTSQAVLYVNGQRVLSRLASGYIPGNNCPLLIGSTHSGDYFQGEMDEICFFDTAFDDDEVKSLFAQKASIAV